MTRRLNPFELLKRGDRKVGKFQIGFMVAVLLFVETLAEYFFALNVDSDTARFLGLAAMQIMNATLIVYFYMHVYRLWRKEAH